MAFVPRALVGFEQGGLQQLSAVTGDVAISNITRPEANGAYSLVLGTGTSSATIEPYEFQGSANSNAKAIGFWFNPATLTVSNNLITIEDSADAQILNVYITATGTIVFRDKDGSTVDSWTSTGGESGDHFFEIWYEDGSASADWEVFLDRTSLGSGSGADFRTTNSDHFFIQAASSNLVYFDDIYFGEATTSADCPHGMDIFATVGDGSATTGGDTPDAGTLADTQEIPTNDSNLASYNAPAGGDIDEREAPTSIAVQTNLTGAVTDIDDDPDSPDGLWLTASGSSTLRALMADPTGPPTVGADLQEFRVLMRKDATGPAGGGTERLAPNVLVTQTNLSGAVTDIDDDPDSPDGLWLTSIDDTAVTVGETSYPDASGPLDAGAGLQEIRCWLRRTNNSTRVPTVTVAIYEGTTLIVTGVSSANVNSTSGEIHSFTWDSSLLTDESASSDVRVRISGSSTGGPAGQRNGVETGAVEWNAAYAGVETQPGYEIKLYENGSEVVGAGSETGTLTDAGGDTVVSFTWDATELGTADGSLVECYVNQTSGADRYIEIGAVEWNCKYPTPLPAESGWIEADSGNRKGPNGYQPFVKNTYYFDASDEGPDDASASWGQDDKAFDGLIGTSDKATATLGETGQLSGGGTTAPTSGSSIFLVEVRHNSILQNSNSALVMEIWTNGKGEILLDDIENFEFYSQEWRPYHTLTVPTGGWTWQKINDLEVYLNREETDVGDVAVFKIEVKVTSLGSAATLNEIIALTTYIRTQYSGSGSVLSHSLYQGNDDVGVFEVDLGNATASLADFFSITSSATITPSTTEHTRVGFGHPVDVDVDIDCTEIIGMVAHLPASDRVVICAPEVIAVIENAATVIRNVPRVVSCTPEVIAVTEPDATVVTALKRDVTTIPEAIAITENDATVFTNVPLIVTCTPEVILVTENDSTINTNVPLIVTCTPELIALVENNCIINRERGVATVSEIIAIIENDSTVQKDRGVNTTPEIIVIIENDAAIDTNVPRVVAGIPEAIAVTENNSSINRARGVAGVPEAILVVEQDATVNAGRIVASIPELIAVLENESTIQTDRGVTALSELIAVTENDATITTGANRIVTCTPEAVAVIEALSTINRGRGVTCLAEVIAVTEPLSIINRGRGVATLSELISVIENDSMVIKDRGVNTLSEMIAVTENLATVNGSRAVSGIPELVAVTENNSVINRGRGVVTSPEMIAVIENNSVINPARGVAAAPEVISIIENNSVIQTDRGVAAVPEVIVVTENDATVVAGAGRSVICISEAIAVVEPPSNINRGLVIVTTPELIAVVENDSIVRKDRGVNTISEVITVTENDATIGWNHLTVDCATEVILVYRGFGAINRGRGVVCAAEVIAVVGNNAIIIRGGVVRRVFIVS